MVKQVYKIDSDGFLIEILVKNFDKQGTKIDCSIYCFSTCREKDIISSTRKVTQ